MQVTVRKEMAVSARALWRLLTDFRIPPKHLGLESFTIEGEGIGHVRKLYLAGGERVVERLEALDTNARSLRVSLSVESPRIPWKESECTVTVFERDRNQCTMECVVQFDPMGVEESLAHRRIEGIYLGFMSAIEDELTGAV